MTVNDAGDQRIAIGARVLRTEFDENPLGIDTARPRLSWEVYSSERHVVQKAFRIEVYEEQALESHWDSGIVESERSVNAEYSGPALKSRTQYRWRVQLWSTNGEVSAWSDFSSFETAFLLPDEWTAGWIRGGNQLRTEFDATKTISRARAYVAGLGYYEMRINGERVGDHVLDGPWTDYDLTVLYATYDVTALVKEGENAIGVWLGNGRYSMRDDVIAKNWHPVKKYGQSPVFICQVHVTYTDGTEDVVVTDEGWKVSQGPIVADDIYDGETYDARREAVGWDRPGFDSSGWSAAVPVSERMGKLIAQGTFPPIRVVKHRNAVSLTQPEPGVYLYDFGQNFSGWVRLRVRAERGTRIQVHFAELRHEDTGMLNPNTNRNAIATDVYIARGEGVEEYEPHFTYHGFRFVELRGYPGAPSIDDVEARVVHTDVKTVGNFSCSDELINQIHSNYRWTQVSNFHSVPTDCNQRDERMGWVGDAQLSAEAATYNYDVAAFYSKFAADIRDSQRPTGSVAGVSPPYWEAYPVDPTYATAAVEFPWVVSRYYADARIVEDSLDSMTRWVDFLTSQADEEGIVSFGLFGDWCPPMHQYPVDTPFEITSTWFYAHDALLVSRMARFLGRDDVAERYHALFEKVRDDFNTRFLRQDRYSASKFSDEQLREKIRTWLEALPPEEHPAIMKRYATLYAASSQTSNLLPLWLGIVPAESEADVFATLVRDIEAAKSEHINTGVVGVKFLFDVLLRYGRGDLAMKLIQQTTFPSWGYQIREGATTLWERWEYLDSDQVFNSHSHPFSGSVDAWLYKAIGGIRIADELTGFARLELGPQVSEHLTYATARIQTHSGDVLSRWQREAGRYTHEIRVPGNSVATVSIPLAGFENPQVAESEVVFWGGDSAGEIAGVLDARREDDTLVLRVGSGHYVFDVKEEV